jgi:hypothetical protein
VTHKQYLMIVAMLWLIVANIANPGWFKLAAGLAAGGYFIGSVVAAWRETGSKP